jgi:hypothetical protein
MAKRLLVYELNEVPLKVLYRYAELRPESFVAFLLSNAFCAETKTKDQGELHPWSTWATLHRGVNNNVHKVMFLNQDLAGSSPYKPIWQLLSDSGVTTGICGSLNSSHIPEATSSLFHIPDTFSPHHQTKPRRIGALQHINLKLVAKSQGQTESSVTLPDLAGLLPLLCPYGYITPDILVAYARQFLQEIKNPIHKKYRSALQAPLFFDAYKCLHSQYSPQYSSIFTNHVAGMLHRYWRYFFSADPHVSRPHSEESLYSTFCLSALDIVSSQLEALVHICNKSSADLWILSSMGQSAIDRGEHYPEYRLLSGKRLLESITEDPSVYSILPAMHPDLNIAASTSDQIEELKKALERLTVNKTSPLFRVRYQSEATINLIIDRSATQTSDLLYIDQERIDSESLGLQAIRRDQGTAYHCPNGSFIHYSTSSEFAKGYSCECFDTRVFAPAIMRRFSLAPKDYMLPTASLPKFMLGMV